MLTSGRSFRVPATWIMSEMLLSGADKANFQQPGAPAALLERCLKFFQRNLW
jgi:hypothetical protein